MNRKKAKITANITTAQVAINRTNILRIVTIISMCHQDNGQHKQKKRNVNPFNPILSVQYAWVVDKITLQL
jgi:ATP adenylyltransferase/5',5'''-P-1,P-4-tetraphosphate phosphorylase II